MKASATDAGKTFKLGPTDWLDVAPDYSGPLTVKGEDGSENPEGVSQQSASDGKRWVWNQSDKRVSVVLG